VTEAGTAAGGAWHGYGRLTGPAAPLPRQAHQTVLVSFRSVVV
jgi:hypothetical protein